ncbi:HNH endonuclease [Rhodococcus rhodochrous]|uniref:HNH endonuclease n=1 Tax=Rhodococcus rhodochrous TaxID=1829 RepID=UPI001C956209|nr:HNH endonuclease [Rhodococcus rhodochrous]
MVCGFDFARVSRTGHRLHRGPPPDPLHAAGEVTSTLEDLILLCANCHRMIHRSNDSPIEGLAHS